MAYTDVDSGSASGVATHVSTLSVAGGTLIIVTGRGTGGPNSAPSVACTFIGASAGTKQRYLALMSGRSDAGVALAGSPSTGIFGVSRTAGTSLALTGNTATAAAVTDKAIFETTLPDSYAAGSNIPVTVNAIIAGAGTLTQASTTLTLTAYSETNGVEAALSVTAAQQITKTGGDLTFTVTGTGLQAGQRLVLELTALVTTSAGSCNSSIRSVSFTA